MSKSKSDSTVARTMKRIRDFIDGFDFLWILLPSKSWLLLVFIGVFFYPPYMETIRYLEKESTFITIVVALSPISLVAGWLGFCYQCGSGCCSGIQLIPLYLAAALLNMLYLFLVWLGKDKKF